MGKQIKRVVLCFLVAVFFWCGTLLADREKLNHELIRLHVVANSDSETDQNIKLQVRDAVIDSIEKDLRSIADIEEAKTYLQKNLPKIQMAANKALQAADCNMEAVVSLCREAFDTRYYDTFTLPAGVYEALRITIGSGEGKNWWCVAFPSLCIPATADGFQDTAASAGFSDSLTCALTEEAGYEIRFFFLDAIGKLENMFFRG